MKATKGRLIIDQVLTGEYYLHSAKPLTFTDKDIEFLNGWNPQKENDQREKSIVLKRLNEFRRDLELGGAKQ